MRGRKPKPTFLRIVQGNPGKRPLPPDEPMPLGVPVRPKWLRKRRAIELWDEVLAFAFWLRAPDIYKLAMWADKQADFERSHRQWRAADLREHRGLGAELGLDPVARARMGAREKPKPDPADKYF